MNTEPGPLAAHLVPRTQRPQVRRGSVVRQELLDRLAALDDDIRLLVLVAPAGYGKTTAVSQWADASDRPFAWVQLDRADDDPLRLLRGIAVALHPIAPADEAVWRMLTSREPFAAETAVALIGAALRDCSKPVVLVLDDLHHVRRPEAFELLRRLTCSLPPGCRLVLASQQRPSMRLSWLRSQGWAAELGPPDLAFSDDEAAALLRRVAGELPEGEARTVARRTEGWPAGVYLVALALQGKPGAEAAAAVEAIRGHTRYIGDYFRQEVLTQLSDRTTAFLLRTSVLEQLSAPLCDAVLESTDSGALLSEIEAANLFVIPQDDRGEWFRYHGLFAELLVHELRRREPTHEPVLLRRAAAWCEAHGQLEQAVDYALAARDDAHAARLIARLAQRLHAEGGIKKIVSWLVQLPDAALEGHPPCADVATAIWAFAGDDARARRCLRIVEAGGVDQPFPGGSASPEATIARLRALVSPDGVGVMLADAERAVRLEPPGSRWHPMSRALEGYALLLTGSTEAAERSFECAVQFAGEAQRPAACVSLAQLALIAAHRGDWSAAEARLAHSRQVMEAGKLAGHVLVMVMYVADAVIALHQGDRVRADECVQAASRLYPPSVLGGLSWYTPMISIMLGRLHLELGDLPAAQAAAQAAQCQLVVLRDTGVLAAHHRDLVARLERAREAAATLPSPLTMAEARILQLLPSHLSLAEIAAQLNVSPNTVKTQTRAVYRKLGAASRSQAIRRARELGLVGEAAAG